MKNWGLSTALWMSLKLDYPAPIKSLDECRSQQLDCKLSPNYPGKPIPESWHLQTMRDNNVCFKLPSLGEICYTAIDKEYITLEYYLKLNSFIHSIDK